MGRLRPLGETMLLTNSLFRTWRTQDGTGIRAFRRSKTDLFFPAKFPDHDPIVKRLDRHRRQGHRVALVLLHLENFGQMLQPGQDEQLIRTQRAIGDKLIELLPVFFKEKAIIGVKKFHGEDFCVFLHIAESESYLSVHYQALRIRDTLVKRLLTDERMKGADTPSFGVGFFALEKEPAATQLALSIAYRYAHAIAARRLPANFGHARQQLLDIIEREQIHVLSQPIMDLRSGEIFGWEILTRGPEATPFNSPADLFEYAHQTDLLGLLEILVVKKTLMEITERAIEEQVFVNLTSVTLKQPLFYDRLLEFLELFPSVRPERIIFEITERHPIRDFRGMAEIMKRYRDLGFRFALDDTGAGYASLQSISELNPEMIKIDRSLISHIDQGKVKQSLLRALMSIARDINCEVIAEGIEREEEADMLLRNAVTKAQGYYFAEPAPLYQGGAAKLREIGDRIRLRFKSANLLA